MLTNATVAPSSSTPISTPPRMTILITGGPGKTGSRISQLLHNAGHTVLIASRSGNAPSPLHGVHLDWLNTATHTNPFTEAEKHGLGAIDRVYLVSPPTFDCLTHMKPFIDLAVQRGVKRFVLISASAIEKGAMAFGKVHEYIADLGVDYCVIRPTWFNDGFKIAWLQSIHEQNEITSAAGDGKIPWVAVDDVADAAFKALTVEPSPNTDWMVVGPELFTFDQVTALFSVVLGRQIVHKRNTVEEQIAFYLEVGFPAETAPALSSFQALVATGVEDAAFNVNENKFVGKTRLRDWVENNKAMWVTN